MKKQPTKSGTRPDVIEIAKGERVTVQAGEVNIFISRSPTDDDVTVCFMPKRNLFEVAVIPRQLKFFVLRAVQAIFETPGVNETKQGR